MEYVLGFLGGMMFIWILFAIKIILLNRSEK